MLYLILIFFSLNSFSFDIVINGNTRTRDSVIMIELQDLLSKPLSPSITKEVKRRLWNLRVFSRVSLKPKENTLNIEVSERWTTIPIAKFSSGGDTSYIALGLYDINTLGRNTELGIQYEELNGKPAAVAWTRIPHFLNDRNSTLGIDLWTINRVRSFFDEEGEESGAFTLIRKKYNLFYEKKYQSDFITLGTNIDFLDDEVSEFQLGEKLVNLNITNNTQFNEKNRHLFLSFYARVGRLNYKNYLVDGFQFDIKVSVQKMNDNIKKEIISTDNSLGFLYYKLFENHLNFAWNLTFEQTTAESIQFQKYVGGFSEVRGYRDGQFIDKSFWKNNLELRFDLFERSWGVIQGATFTDQAKEGSDFNNIIDSSDEILLSSGVGIRLISPKIFRFVGRIDYAQTHTRFIDQSLSVGIQQFF